MSSSGYEDLRLVKMMLDLNERMKPKENDRTQELILFGASLEALRDLKDKVDRINEKLALMDYKNDKEIKKEEKSLLDQIKQLDIKEKEALVQLIKPQEEKIEETRVELENPEVAFDNIDIVPIESVATRKKALVKDTVIKYGKITSSQLARIIGLSRTRCNEYLKELEESGNLTAFTEDKKRYYQIKQV